MSRIWNFLYYAYLWHDILHSEQQYWTIDKGELVPLHNEDFLLVQESTSKQVTNRNFKKHIQTDLVTEKPSNDDSQQNISLSRKKCCGSWRIIMSIYWL